MEGSALTIDDIQNLIHVCREGNVSVIKWGELVIDFFREGEADDDDEDDEPTIGFDAMPSPVVVPDASDDEEEQDQYDRLFGGQKPKFKRGV